MWKSTAVASKEPGWAQTLRDVVVQVEASEPRLGQDDGVEGPPERLVESGLHIPADVDDSQVGAGEEQLRASSE